MRALPALAVAAGWSVVGVALSGLTRTLYTLFIANTSGPSVSGVVGAQIALAVFATMVWPAATGSAASKFVARAHGQEEPGLAGAVASFLFRRTLLTGAVAGLLAVGAAVVVLDEPARTATVLLPLVLAYSAYLLTRGVLLGAGRVAVAARWELLALVVSLGLLTVALAVGATPWLVLPLALGYLAYAVAGHPGRTGTRRVEPELRREMDAFVAWGVLGNIASAGLLQLCLVVSGATLSTVDTGLLTVAVGLATPASMAARSLVQVLFPAMARSVGAGDTAAVHRRTDVVSRGIVAVFVPMFAVLTLFADPLLRLAGRNFGEGAPALRILLVAVMFTTLPVAAVASMTSGSRDGIRRSALMSATGLGVGLLGLAVLTGPFGVEGIAVAYLLGSLVTTALPWVWAWRNQGQRWAGPTVRVLVGVLVLTLAVWAQRVSTLPGPVTSAGLAVVFVLGWVALSRRDLRVALGRA